MNNGKFDLKRKIAFAAALLVVSHSVGAMPVAATSSSAVKMQSNDRRINVNDEEIENTGAHDGEDDAPETPACTTSITTSTTNTTTSTTNTTTTASDDNSGNVTYTIDLCGAKLDYEEFRELATHIFNAEAEIDKNKIIVKNGAKPKLEDYKLSNKKIYFKNISPNEKEIKFEVYYKVEKIKEIKHVKIVQVENDDTEKEIPEEGYIKYNSRIKFIPDDEYSIEGLSEPITVDSALKFEYSHEYNERYLKINNNWKKFVPRKLHLNLPNGYKVYKKGQWGYYETGEREFAWNELYNYYIEHDKDKDKNKRIRNEIVIECHGKSETIQYGDGKFELSELFNYDDLKYQTNLSVSDKKEIYKVRSGLNVFNERGEFVSFDALNTNYVPVHKESDGYYIYVPYIDENKYHLINYKYKNGDDVWVNFDKADRNGFVKIKVHPDEDYGQGDNIEIVLGYKEFEKVDNHEDYKYSYGDDVHRRNEKCYAVNNSNDSKLMNFDSHFNGSEIYYCNDQGKVCKKTIDSDNYTWSKKIDDNKFIYVYNIIKDGEKRILPDSGICFYNDKEAPNVTLKNMQGEDVKSNKVVVGKETTDFYLSIDDKAAYPSDYDNMSSLEQEFIRNIYDNYINCNADDVNKISSIVIGDYKFDRPADGWDSSEIYTRTFIDSTANEELNELVGTFSGTELSTLDSVKEAQNKYEVKRHISSADLTAIEEEYAKLGDNASDAMKKEYEDFSKKKSEYIDAFKKVKMKSVPTLIYDPNIKLFKVSIEAPEGYQDAQLKDDIIRIYAIDEENNKGTNDSKKIDLTIQYDTDPPVIKNLSVSEESNTVDEDNIKQYILKEGSKISVDVADAADNISSVVASMGKILEVHLIKADPGNGYAYKIKNNDMKNDLKGSVEIRVQDLGQNIANYSSEAFVDKFIVIIDNTKPEISIQNSSDEGKYYTKTEVENGEERTIKWFSKFEDVCLDVIASDPNPDICSGIKELKIEVNNKSVSYDLTRAYNLSELGINEAKLQEEGNYYITFVKKENDKFDVVLKDFNSEGFSKPLIEGVPCTSMDVGIDEIKVTVAATDYANNDSEENCVETVSIDRNIPEVTDISAHSIYDSSMKCEKEELEYSVFSNAGFDVDITVKGGKSGLGIDKVYAKFYDERGEHIEDWDRDAVRSDKINIWNVTIPVNFKGYIEAYAVDKFERESMPIKTKGIITENEAKHYETSDIKIELPQTEHRDVDGRPLYDRALTGDDIKLSVSDTFSGIKDVTARKILNDGSTTEYNDFEDGRSEHGIDIEKHRSIDASEDSNNITIELELTDNANNHADNHTEKANFSIDLTDPKIDVVFKDADGNNDNGGKELYNTKRKAVITITECNFDSSLAEVIVNGSRLAWNDSNVSGNGAFQHSMEVPFDEDGVYDFTVRCTDLAGRTAQEKNAKFEIDTTAPKLDVGFNKSITNSHYYNEPVVATFSISDANFDAQSINISGTYNNKAEDFPKVSEWTRNGDTYVSTARFDKNGEYEITISGKDRAGNALETYKGKFCIDTKKPTITTGNVQKSNNGAEVRPHIKFADPNIDKNSIKIELNGANRGKSLEYSGELIETKDGYEYIFDNFPQTIEYDDIYTIKASAKDNANNKIENELQFSVNRFGSNFILDEDTAAIVEKFISEPRDIIITECNPDKHANANSVFITKDSEMIELKEGKDYRIEESGGNGAWTEYKYVIFAKNFDEDAKYSVSIHSEDEAGNINVSAALKKNASVSFSVDKTKPLCIPINISENSTYKGESYIAKISASDNVALKDVKIYIDGKPVTMNVDNDEYSFEIYNSNHAQEISIVLTDMADNEAEYKYKNILVTTSVLRLLVRKTWFKVTGGATLLLAGASAFFVRRKRKYR